jgi:hypothetical protein
MVFLICRFGDLGTLFSFHRIAINILLCLSRFLEFTCLAQVHLGLVTFIFISFSWVLLTHYWNLSMLLYVSLWVPWSMHVDRDVSLHDLLIFPWLFTHFKKRYLNHQVRIKYMQRCNKWMNFIIFLVHQKYSEVHLQVVINFLFLGYGYISKYV